MRINLPTLARTLLIAALPLFASPAFAQATRTWVSGVGDDANPCSRTAPCKTFAGAISKTAARGEISVLDPGGYGGVTINKALTISGDGTLASILVGGTNGIIVNAGVNDVVIIRSISIIGIGTGLNGIRFLAGGELHVENVSISGFTLEGISFEPSGASGLFVNNSSIRNCTQGGVLVKPTGTGTAAAALNSVALVGNGRGLRAEDGSTVTVSNSHAAGNDLNGFVALGTSRAVNMTLESSVAASNGATGIYSGNLTTVKISNVTVTRNNAGLQTAGGSIVSFGNNRVYDNTTLNGPPTTNVGQM
jgi:hypothetical protein